MSYLDQAKSLYEMINTGQAMDAFEKYYSDDCVMVEATGESWEGKEANRKREQSYQWIREGKREFSTIRWSKYRSKIYI